jgi:hypothetical protein
MRIQARVEWSERDEKTAKAMAEALEPCNKKAPRGVKIYTYAVGKKVVTEINLRGKMETLTATLDDLLACASMSQKVLKI